MTPFDKLCSLKMCVTWHDQGDFLFSSGCYDGEKVYQVALDLPQLIPQPQTHIRSNLLISAPAGV